MKNWVLLIIFLLGLHTHLTFANSVQFSNDLGFKLLAHHQNNVTLSPLSISQALLLARAGAKEKSKTELDLILGKDIGNELLTNLEQKEIKIANRVWAEKTFSINPEYDSFIQNNYKASIVTLNFKNDVPGSVSAINSWVESTTENKIQDLVSENTIFNDTLLVLTNAIYFKANWQKKFKKEGTYNEDFFLNKNQKVNVPFMHQTNEFDYYEDSKYRVLFMPYKDSTMNGIVVLPKNIDSSLSTLKQLRHKQLVHWTKNKKKQLIQLALPKFKSEKSLELKKDLKQLGLKNIFERNLANFSGISLSKERLYISEIIHKSCLEVDEEGTEATAATAVLTMAGSARPKETIKPIIFKADRPFLFLIVESEKNTVLFASKIYQTARQ